MLRKQEYYETQIWPGWMEQVQDSPQHVIFLHGTMGSELYDPHRQRVLWVDLGAGRDMDRLCVQQLTPEGLIDCGNQEIYACSTVHAPIVRDPYAAFLKKIQAGPFCYDWREDITVEVQRLALFLRKVQETIRKPMNIVTHSMGGCVLFYLLGKTAEFDNALEHIIFCAPPFHGSLKVIQVVEDGDGTPIDLFVSNSVLSKSVASMPGLFQLALAPREYWIDELPGGPKLDYPIRGGESLYQPEFWTNARDREQRGAILRIAEAYQRERWQMIDPVLKRLGEKIFVFVGLNGKTYRNATKENGRWKLSRGPRPKAGMLSNGDGTVLFQASYLPGLPTERYWAVIPDHPTASAEAGDDLRWDIHGGIVDQDKVIHDIQQVLNNQLPTQLLPYEKFIDKIDWRGDLPGTRDMGMIEELDYIERARLRAVTPKAEWGERLNPGSDDALTYFLTEQAALQVLSGDADLETAARRIGVTPEFLLQHIQRQLMPVLF